jgi:hypothetical protein
MDKKKLTFIAGSGIVVLALIGFFAVWPPAVQDDQASGAIGAVKKHNAPQITAADVVLTDEAGRIDDRIVYADLINDAVKLQSFSDALASRDNLASIETQLASHEADLQGRFVQSFSDALANAESLQSKGLVQGNRDLLEAIRAEFQSRTQGNRQQLGHADMDALNQKFAQFASRTQQGSREDALASIDAQLASATRNLQSREAHLASEALESMRQQLGSLDQLESMRQLQSHQDYLESIEMQSRVVAQSREQLGRGVRADFGSVSRSLASEAASLENRAMGNMTGRLQNRVEYANRVEQMNRSLGSMRQQGNREALGSRQFSQSLGSFEQELQSREAAMANRVAHGSRAELASIDQLMSRSAGSRLVAESRLATGNRDQLGRKAGGQQQEFGNRDMLGSNVSDMTFTKSSDKSTATLNSAAESYLANLNRALNSMDQISNREQLQSMAAEMANRANLASRAAATGNRANN